MDRRVDRHKCRDQKANDEGIVREDPGERVPQNKELNDRSEGADEKVFLLAMPLLPGKKSTKTNEEKRDRNFFSL